MRVARLTSYLLTKAASALAVPTTTADGLDIQAWRTGEQGFARALVRLYGTAATLTSVTLWGYDARWYEIGLLKTGKDIVVTTGRGYAEIMAWPSLFTHLAVSAGGAAAITYEVMPLESH
jgi:hypothetical protein